MGGIVRRTTGLYLVVAAFVAAPAFAQEAKCIEEITEAVNFQAEMRKGIESGRIDAKEKAALEKTHAELMAMVQKARAEFGVSADECYKIRVKLVQANQQLAAAMAPGPAKCMAEIQQTWWHFEEQMKFGIQDGTIDPKEVLALAKTHAELTAMVERAYADRNLSEAECKKIHDKFVEEDKKLASARASGPGNCLNEIAKAWATFQTEMEKGIQSGKIDPKEKAALEKTHAELVAMVARALADVKLSPAECKKIHDRIAEENKQLAAVMASGPKVTGPAKCIEEIKKQWATFQAAMGKGIQSGKIDVKERAALQKTHAELAGMVGRAAADAKLSADECMRIHNKIVEENKKLALAMASK
jgi:hypothetical protein